MWQEKSCLKEQISEEPSMTNEEMQKRDKGERDKSMLWVQFRQSFNLCKHEKTKAFPNIILSTIWFILAIVLNHRLWGNKSLLLESKKKIFWK